MAGVNKKESPVNSASGINRVKSRDLDWCDIFNAVFVDSVLSLLVSFCLSPLYNARVFSY